MTIKPLNNNVLLKVTQSNAKIRLSESTELYVPWGNEAERHSDVVCEVVAVPDRLRYKVKERTPRGQGVPEEGSMEWKTEMELRVGDSVIIHYMAFVSSIKKGDKIVEIEGVQHFFCPYDLIILAKRKWTPTETDAFWKQYDQSTTKYITQEWMNQKSIVIDGKDIYNVIMLNGNILVNPVEKEIKSTKLILPDSLTKTNKKLVKACYVGSNNQEYMNGVYADADVEPNDTLIIDKDCNVLLQPEEHRTFNGKQEYWWFSKALVHAIIRNQEI
jgi:co-chaperonin GroES (HSP10)